MTASLRHAFPFLPARSEPKAARGSSPPASPSPCYRQMRASLRCNVAANPSPILRTVQAPVTHLFLVFAPSIRI